MTKAKYDDDEPLTTTRTSDRGRTVALPTGGTLRFTLDVNLLKCGPEDRAFLFGIIDMLDAYEKARDEKAHGGTDVEKA
jgi:hypothetical protein